MTDPFYMLMLMENLNPGGGRGYVVWDKAATIRYKRPGTGTVRAEFRLSAERIEEIRAALDVAGVEKVEPVFLIAVKDEAGQVVAEVEKTIYCARAEVHRARRRGAGIQ
jgi:hypothetical protein